MFPYGNITALGILTDVILEEGTAAYDKGCKPYFPPLYVADVDVFIPVDATTDVTAPAADGAMVQITVPPGSKAAVFSRIYIVCQRRWLHSVYFTDRMGNNKRHSWSMHYNWHSRLIPAVHFSILPYFDH